MINEAEITDILPTNQCSVLLLVRDKIILHESTVTAMVQYYILYALPPVFTLENKTVILNDPNL